MTISSRVLIEYENYNPRLEERLSVIAGRMPDKSAFLAHFKGRSLVWRCRSFTQAEMLSQLFKEVRSALYVMQGAKTDPTWLSMRIFLYE